MVLQSIKLYLNVQLISPQTTCLIYYGKIFIFRRSIRRTLKKYHLENENFLLEIVSR